MDTWTPPDADFPALAARRYRKTSEPDAAYNCVAFALGRTDLWLGPEPYGYQWPLPSIETSVENFVRLFEHYGFAQCSSGDFEKGKDKLAIFGSQFGFTHVARQLENGRWSSKLG